jgi:hypothetical protein
MGMLIGVPKHWLRKQKKNFKMKLQYIASLNSVPYTI